MHNSNFFHFNESFHFPTLKQKWFSASNISSNNKNFNSQRITQKYGCHGNQIL